MRTRIGDPRLLVAPVGFALLAVALSIAAWSTFGGTLPLQPKSYRFSVVVPQAQNLQPGAAVRSAGVDIGRVVGVEPSGPRARIIAQLQPSYAPLRSSARVMVRAKSLLGEAYLQVSLGDRRSPAVKEGGELSPRNVIPSQRLDDVLATFQPSTRGDMRRLVGTFSRAVQGRRLDLSAASAEAAPAARGLADLAEVAARQTGDLHRLIRNGGEVLAEVGARQGSVRALVTEGNALLDVTARRRERLGEIIAAAPSFLAAVKHASDVVTAAAPELSDAVDALAPAAPLLTPALTSVDGILPDTRALMADLPRPLRAAERGIPSLQRMLTVLGPVFGKVWPALREAVPIVQFAAEDPSFLIATAANLASATNAYVAGPGGTRQRYVRAVPMIWNEMAAGFEKPLPTSRQNQYPKPGSLAKIGKAPFEAWSCSNLHNEQTIPVIPPGTGAPPCRVQGPWNFRGKSAYYPRLERAAP